MIEREPPELDRNPHYGVGRGQIAAGRRLGASPEHRAALADLYRKMEWTGTCRRCQANLKGLPAELAVHRCEAA